LQTLSDFLVSSTAQWAKQSVHVTAKWVTAKFNLQRWNPKNGAPRKTYHRVASIFPFGFTNFAEG